MSQLQLAARQRRLEDEQIIKNCLKTLHDECFTLERIEKSLANQIKTNQHFMRQGFSCRLGNNVQQALEIAIDRLKNGKSLNI